MFAILFDGYQNWTPTEIGILWFITIISFVAAFRWGKSWEKVSQAKAAVEAEIEKEKKS